MKNDPKVGEYYGDPLANVFKIESVDGEYVIVSKAAGIAIMPDSNRLRFHVSSLGPRVEWPMRTRADWSGLKKRIRCNECNCAWDWNDKEEFHRQGCTSAPAEQC